MVSFSFIFIFLLLEDLLFPFLAAFLIIFLAVLLDKALHRCLIVTHRLREVDFGEVQEVVGGAPLLSLILDGSLVCAPKQVALEFLVASLTTQGFLSKFHYVAMNCFINVWVS